MRLDDLLGRLTGVALNGDGSTEVSGIALDSRRIGPGMVFAALPGHRCHGIDFLPQAVERGAAAVLSDRPRPDRADLPWMRADDPRRIAALAAWLLAGEPQRRLRTVAVTGTNGKSTTVALIAAGLEAAGAATGVFGTLGYRLPSTTVPGDRTTPEATDLAPLFAQLLAEGGRAVVMEASSHALVQDRLAGLEVEVAVWTNLTRDHLDFHLDMESYFRAKRLLFDRHLAPGGRRVLPVDEPWGARLLAEPRAGDVTWGLGEGTVHARDVEASLEGTELTLVVGEGAWRTRTPLLGLHNLRNALAAAAALTALEIPVDFILRALERARPLPGRLEPAQVALPFPVLIDFAHTPEGLRAVLSSLRAVTDRRLIVVFGAGGDKDRGKREPMGRAVGELADLAVVTSDNPRSEDPAAIAEAVAAGVRAAGREPEVVLDRRTAIAHALAAAGPDALVVIAGKGHETEQVIGDRRLPFSDLAVVAELAGGLRCG